MTRQAQDAMSECISKEIEAGMDHDQAVAICIDKLGTNQNDDMRRVQTNVRVKSRFETFDDREHIVLPVVMAIAQVEMNGGVIPDDELQPESWNGVPVTVNHPTDNNQQFISANSPETLEAFSVGRLFNAHVDAGKLKAEAWIDTSKISDELGRHLTSGDSIDVSTGYFSKFENNEYRDIKPDHLAILTNEEGACSFSDGCGIRANKKTTTLEKVMALFKKQSQCACQNVRAFEQSMVRTLEKLQDTVEDKVASDATVVDATASTVTYETGDAGSRQKFKQDYEMDDDGFVTLMGDPRRVDDDGSDSDNDSDADNGSSDSSSDDESSMNQNRETRVFMTLSKDDRFALEYARTMANNHRQSLIKTIQSKAKVDEGVLKTMSVDQLQAFSDGIEPQANYLGRAMPSEKMSHNEDNNEVIANMAPKGPMQLVETKRGQS